MKTVFSRISRCWEAGVSEVTEAWSQVAAAWDHNVEFVERVKAPVTEHLLGELAIRSGESVLELGAGPGGLGARLAGLVGGGGRVIVSDIAEGMVDAARQRLARLPGVVVRQLDASAIELPDESQDVVVFRMGLMLVPEPGVAMKDIRRLLRPGGRVGVVVWAGPEHNPWMTSLGIAAMMQGLVAGGPPTGPGGVFSLGDPDVLAATISAAGFDSVMVESVGVSVPFSDLDSYFAYITSMAGPLAHALASATADQMQALRATVAAVAAPHRTATGGFELPGLAHVAVATR